LFGIDRKRPDKRIFSGLTFGLLLEENDMISNLDRGRKIEVKPYPHEPAARFLVIS
jgi:hypothetical protein